MKKLSRRTFLHSMGLAGAGVALAACVAPTAPQTQGSAGDEMTGMTGDLSI